MASKFPIPIKDFTEHLEEMDRLLYACKKGLHGLIKAVPLVEAVAKLPPSILRALEREESGDEKEDEDVIQDDQRETELIRPEESQNQTVENARRDAEFAHAEVDEDFPNLHAHFAVSLWSALEFLIEDTVIALLNYRPDFLEAEEFARTKVRVAPFIQMDEIARLRFLVNEVDRSLGSGFKAGSNRFEPLLGTLGLSLRVDRGVREALFELWQIRNVLVHRASVVDEKLKDACPWLDQKVGEKLRITSRQYGKYRLSIIEYSTELLNSIHRLLSSIEEKGEADGKGVES